MTTYRVYYQLGPYRLKTDVEASNPVEAERKVKDKIEIIKVVRTDDDILRHIKNILNI